MKISTDDMPHVALVSLYNYSSWGIRTLFTILKKHGYKTTAIFFKTLRYNDISPPTDNEIQELIAHLIKLAPNAVGLSVNSSNFGIASIITQNIKQNLPVPVVWGGPHPTVLPEQCLTVADMVCIGEGDHTILDFASAMKEGKDITHISNLWINKNGEILKNPLRPLIQDLDWLPVMDRDNDDKFWIEDNKLSAGDPVWNVDPPSRYTLMASRGCPFHCTYCSNSIYKDIYKDRGSFVRKRSVDNVIEELRIAKEQLQINKIQFLDEVFILDKEWITNFCERYKAEINLPFQCVFHPTIVREDLVSMLADSGLDEVNMGIQSGSEYIRKHIFRRPGSNQLIKDDAALFKKCGIIPYYDIILDNPYETSDHKRETVKLLLDVPRPFNLSMYSLCWFPGTVLTRRALKDGVISQEQVEGIAKKTHKEWRVRLDRSNRVQDQFWNSLVFLTSLRFNSDRNSRSKHAIPRSMIYWLMDNKLLRRHPKLLTSPTLLWGCLVAPSRLVGVPLARYILHMHTGLRLLFKGEFALFFSKFMSFTQKSKN